MNLRIFIIFSIFILGFLHTKGSTLTNSKAANTFSIGEGAFILNGEPFVIKAAELHYPRIPAEYWDQRIKMCKALGMNTICLYAFWNIHEPIEDMFDFKGQNDIRKFIELCEDNDMMVILRPGPYVCAEWEMGGLPWWLIKKKDIRLRENDPYFLNRVEKFEEVLAKEVRDKTILNGGPIIMIQVENEYGSYGEDKEYIANIRDILKRNYGNDITLFQCDWSSNFTLNGLDDLLWTMNFGTGANIDEQFLDLRKLRQESPLMCSEFWSGWFDKWGAYHETRPADDMIAGIDEMLSKNISFSLYMTHGGTNFGHWAGANSPGYAPDVTSYDYDAPINESGQPTQKYWLLREILDKYSEEKLPELPELIRPISIDSFKLTEVAPLFDNLPHSKPERLIKTMEDFDQGFGSIIYTSYLPEINDEWTLIVNEPHDYAQVFIDGQYVGSLDRRKNEKELHLQSCKKGSRLDILVEAMGRINFGKAIKDYKGITENVYIKETIDEKDELREIVDWEVYLLPDEIDFYKNMSFIPVYSLDIDRGARYPRGIYKGKFNVDKPSDTFLNFETWGKGLVYVNNHGIGRIWGVGPQQTLYMPGVWLKEGENEILIFDIIGPNDVTSEGLMSPIIDKLQPELVLGKQVLNEKPEFNMLSPTYSGKFKEGNGWQLIDFGNTTTGSYFAFEPLNSINGTDEVSIAEIYLLDDSGTRISREGWSVFYIDSEDKEGANRTGDKIFDLQESTYWSSGRNTQFPHLIVIDLGREENISGLEYLPRVETGAPGAIKDYNVYILDKINY